MARFWYCGCDHQQRQLTLLLTGLDNAGKTSVLNCLIGKPDIVTPTFGFSSADVKLADCQLHIYDLGTGQSSLINSCDGYL